MDDDVTMIRHLHDLHPLLHLLGNEIDKIVAQLEHTYQKDFRRGGDISADISIAAAKAMHILQTDPLYQSEYENFVTNMCFGPKEEQITFEMALGQFEKLVANL